MKIRSDFVSNSSSSSFIVISNSGKNENTEYIKKEICKNLTDGKLILPVFDIGHTEFDWEVETYNDFWSKVNWCAIIITDLIHYVNPDQQLTDDALNIMVDLNPNENDDKIKFTTKYINYKNMLVNFFKENFNTDIEFNSDPNIMFDAYIDHQSGIFEEPDNARMFLNKDDLYNFLMNSDSTVNTSNDNI